MDALPGTWLALCALAFALGAKHGFDADHLATIDGLTRYNAHENPRVARLAGTLFSLGHGVVVLLVAAVAGSLTGEFQPPIWLEIIGAAVSIVFLFGLAFLNVRAVLVADPRAVVAPAGIKSRLLGRFVDVRRAWAIAAVGMLFALSFDTVSQAALFALAGGRFGGLDHALIVAAVFVSGMLCVDGINGLWISGLIRRADRTAAIASRVMALTVAGIGLAVGTFTVVSILLPAVRAWAEGREVVFGGAVVAAVSLSFMLAMVAARRYSPSAAKV